MNPLRTLLGTARQVVTRTTAAAAPDAPKPTPPTPRNDATSGTPKDHPPTSPTATPATPTGDAAATSAVMDMQKRADVLEELRKMRERDRRYRVETELVQRFRQEGETARQTRRIRAMTPTQIESYLNGWMDA